MKKATHRLVSGMMVWIWMIPSVLAQGLPTTTPESVGLSPQRLERLTAVIQAHIDEQKIAGAVALVARRGQAAYFKALGQQDREAGRPMRTDAIFRIASMTKPITSVAVLMLYEEGHFQLKDPISRYLTEFTRPQVLVDHDPNRTVPAKREITIHDLLTHTSGITYQWDPVLGPLYKRAGVAHGLLPENTDLAHSVRALAGLPLLHQPGEAWTYGLSVDVLGRLVEVVSGMSLEDFLNERILQPLDMHDTCFYLPPDKAERLATVYAARPGGGLKRLDHEHMEEGPFVYSADYPVSGPRKYFSGGAGLCSTAADYARFMQMLLNKGELDGVRLLSPKTVELMTTDHVGPLRREGGFGLGVSVTRSLAESMESGSVGTYGWGGFWYTAFFIDPQEQLMGVFMAQLYPPGPATLTQQFAGLVSQAVVE